MADGMATVDQGQDQAFDPVQELRTRYPGVADEPDDKIVQHLSDPKNFRSAFPEYAHLDDQTIRTNMNRQSAKVTPPTTENLPGLTEKGRENIRKGISPMVPPTQFEAERQQASANLAPKKMEPQEYLGLPSSHTLGAIGQGAKGMLGSIGEGLYDVALGTGAGPNGEITHGAGGLVGLNQQGEFAPMERAGALAEKYISGPAKEEFGKAKEEYNQGNTLGAIGHGAAGALPIIGPYAAHLGERAGTGDITGAAGEAVGTALAGELAAHPVELTKGAGALADKAIRGTPLTEAGKVEAAEQQAMTVKKPAMGELEYANKVHEAIPDLIKIAQDQKGQITTPRKAAQAISDRISQIEAPITDHLASLTGPKDLVQVPDYLPAIGTAIMNDLAKRPGQYSQAEMAKAGKAVSDFVGDKPKTYSELEGNRRRLNQDADAYFHSDTAGKRSIDVSDATAVAQRAAANAIRDVLYGDVAGNPGMLERAGVTAVQSGGQQVPIRALRQKVGNLIDVRDHFEDAITRAEAAGDWNPLAVMKSGPSLAMGGIGGAIGAGAGGPVGAVLGLLAGEGVKAWTDYLRSKNLNLNTTKMFRNLEQVAPQPVVEPNIGAPQRPGQPATSAGGAAAGSPVTAIGPIAPAGGASPATVAPRLTLGNIASQAAPEAGLGTIGGKGREGTIYKPSEKAVTMSAPRKIVPEQEALNFQEEIQRNKDILRNPKATAEDRRIAQSRLDEMDAIRNRK